MCRPVCREAPTELVVDSHVVFGRNVDCWHIYLVAGDMSEAVKHLPFILPWISWERDNKLRFYKTKKLLKRLKKNDREHDREIGEVP
jgi:hypothetical protein